MPSFLAGQLIDALARCELVELMKRVSGCESVLNPVSLHGRVHSVCLVVWGSLELFLFTVFLQQLLDVRAFPVARLVILINFIANTDVPLVLSRLASLSTSSILLYEH